jgi:5'-3' exonuclease, N-terminal resolvase-like domain
VLAGDYNVVPTDLDTYPSKSWDRNALLQPQSRAAYQRLLAQGWTDAVRALHPKEPMYTFWDYMQNRWERDGGLRLDHVLLSSALTERLQSVGVDTHIRGLEDASDHAPVWVELHDAPNRSSSASLVGSHATTVAPSSSKAKKSARRTDGEIKRQSRALGPSKPKPSRRPLLVIDGDSFAHRSYHALPKTIRRSDGSAAAAIVGFVNFLRFYADERPRAIIVGWDTLDAPTKRHEMFPAYQSGREFDEELIEQLSVLPGFVAAFGFANAKAPGFEADDFLAGAVAAEERSGGSALVASGDRIPFSSPRRALRSSTRRVAGNSRVSAPKRSGNDMASSQTKYRTSLHCVVILLTNCLARPGSGRNAPLNWFDGTARLRGSLRPVSFKLRLICSGAIG